MLKYLILSLITFTSLIDCHKTKCTKKCANKHELKAEVKVDNLIQSAICYNYDINEAEPTCPKKLQEPFGYSYGWSCKLSSKGLNGKDLVKSYSCWSKEALDKWYDSMVKDSWFCYKSAKSS